MKRIINKTLLLTCIAGASLCLSGCDNVAVYGSMSVGSSWGSYYGPSYGRGGPHMGSSVTISGRIR
ncbi:hypothetical protein QWY82_18000 [Simiduia curdlanivorans]|uniref:Lipoprotein n=1 Tax=Simiduia curdlanivorans TaxID=1492769 RepID=A0ABV8V5E2_9GAMM|nr:hypothetical protein [Simiduia curdlanivorans]MDN3640696.1 hypothetical protein [Simiduia curdlanivorans]